MKKLITFPTMVVAVVLAAMFSGCATAPDEVDRDTFLVRAKSTTQWFKDNVAGLEGQIAGSAGYIIFPDVAQWGILIGGGSWGRGAVFRASGEQIGWSAINRGSVGLQAGVQGFRMLIVLQNESVLSEFKANKWTGSVNATAVAAEAGTAGKASFTNGVAVYQGAQTGLMAGVNVGLERIRFESRYGKDA
jgi:lipid-binding SYLF domain-containing protein